MFVCLPFHPPPPVFTISTLLVFPLYSVAGGSMAHPGAMLPSHPLCCSNSHFSFFAAPRCHVSTSFLMVQAEVNYLMDFQSPKPDYPLALVHLRVLRSRPSIKSNGCYCMALNICNPSQEVQAIWISYLRVRLLVNTRSHSTHIRTNLSPHISNHTYTESPRKS
jgi:hypothetical protein